MKNSAILKIHDNRINSDNYIFQLTLGEYYDLIKDSLFNNEFQRRKVLNSDSIYSLLKRDLAIGCVLPPIVLAVNYNIDEKEDILTQLTKNTIERPIILDGLQRSITICELLSSNKSDDIRKYPIRIELYTKLSKIWLLYRMLTLNTGQTRMTTRHQIEIIYSGYKQNCNIEGVRFISQIEDESPRNIGEYGFQDIIDGFTSYIQMDYLKLDRMDVLESVKDLQRLAEMESDMDLFNDFVDSYHSFVKYMNDNSPKDIESQIAAMNLQKVAFGKNIIYIFNKSQSLTGFGCAIARLRELKDIRDFTHVKKMISMIDKSSIQNGVHHIIKDLDDVRRYAKKIGNDQRFYFYHFFLSLFGIDNNERSIEKAAIDAYKQYQRISI